jgi:hypothetical protein
MSTRYEQTVKLNWNGNSCEAPPGRARGQGCTAAVPGYVCCGSSQKDVSLTLIGCAGSLQCFDKMLGSSIDGRQAGNVVLQWGMHA